MSNRRSCYSIPSPQKCCRSCLEPPSPHLCIEGVAEMWERDNAARILSKLTGFYPHISKRVPVRQLIETGKYPRVFGQTRLGKPVAVGGIPAECPGIFFAGCSSKKSTFSYIMYETSTVISRLQAPRHYFVGRWYAPVHKTQSGAIEATGATPNTVRTLPHTMQSQIYVPRHITGLYSGQPAVQPALS